MSQKYYGDSEVYFEESSTDSDYQTENYSNSDSTSLCQRFARILQGTILTSQNGLCAVSRTPNLNFQIAGRQTTSPLVIAALFSFESADRQGNTLDLGETVILQNEINPFITALRERGIKVTALHNHWLFDRPRAMHIHWFSIEPPLVYAQKVAEAFRVLENS